MNEAVGTGVVDGGTFYILLAWGVAAVALGGYAATLFARRPPGGPR
jgi:hypothetical protein